MIRTHQAILTLSFHYLSTLLEPSIIYSLPLQELLRTLLPGVQDRLREGINIWPTGHKDNL